MCIPSPVCSNGNTCFCVIEQGATIPGLTNQACVIVLPVWEKKKCSYIDPVPSWRQNECITPSHLSTKVLRPFLKPLRKSLCINQMRKGWKSKKNKGNKANKKWASDLYGKWLARHRVPPTPEIAANVHLVKVFEVSAVRQSI